MSGVFLQGGGERVGGGPGGSMRVSVQRRRLSTYPFFNASRHKPRRYVVIFLCR